MGGGARTKGTASRTRVNCFFLDTHHAPDNIICSSSASQAAHWRSQGWTHWRRIQIVES